MVVDKLGPYDLGRIYQGDCLELMKAIPSGSVDIVMTSPPYNTLPISSIGSGMHKGCGWLKKASCGYPDSMPEYEYQEWMRTVFTECLRITKGLVWVNHKVRYRDGKAVHPCRFLPFPIYSEVIWSRPGSYALNCKRFAPSHEMLIGFGECAYWDDAFNKLMSVWRISYDRGNDDHPCAYPVELASRPIGASCPPDGIVLDPFAGTGTTAIACARLGRRFLGFELDQKWVDLGNDRIKAQKMGMDVDELRAGQTSLLELIE